jgi:uncharacterized protein involved in high-affinity Fe2+ transport
VLVKVVHIGGLLMKIYSFIILVLPTFVCAADLPEMVIGEKDIEPGISLIFEGAIKDDVAPSTIFGLEADSDIHIEVVATWNENGPRGSVNGGFVAYLDITALITNQSSGEERLVRLDPHLNMSDNFHYARNTKLPGERDEIYSVVFYVSGPEISEVGMHYDWREEVGDRLLDGQTFKFSDLDFSRIAEATRR